MNVFLVQVSNKTKLNINSENKGIKWFKFIDSNFPRSMRRILEKAGFCGAP